MGSWQLPGGETAQPRGPDLAPHHVAGFPPPRPDAQPGHCAQGGMGQCRATWRGHSSGSPCWGWVRLGDPGCWAPRMRQRLGTGNVNPRSLRPGVQPKVNPRGTPGSESRKSQLEPGESGPRWLGCGGSCPHWTSSFREQDSHGLGGRWWWWWGPPPRVGPSTCAETGWVWWIRFLGADRKGGGRREDVQVQAGACRGPLWHSLGQHLGSGTRPGAWWVLETSRKSCERRASLAGVGPQCEQPASL